MWWGTGLYRDFCKNWTNVREFSINFYIHAWLLIIIRELLHMPLTRRRWEASLGRFRKFKPPCPIYFPRGVTTNNTPFLEKEDLHWRVSAFIRRTCCCFPASGGCCSFEQFTLLISCSFLQFTLLVSCSCVQFTFLISCSFVQFTLLISCSLVQFTFLISSSFVQFTF